MESLVSCDDLQLFNPNSVVTLGVGTESFSCMHVTGGQEVSELCSMVISCFKLQDIRHLGKAGRPYPTVTLNRQPEPGDRPPSQVKANPQGQRIVFTLYL